MHAQCGTTHTHTHQVCVPYNVLVDAGDAYSITITADQAVINTLRTTIVDSQLRLTTTQPGFSTQQPIRVTVTLPPGSLEGVQVASPQSSVVVQGPAGGDTLTATHTGAGGLFLLDLNASSLTVNAAGCDGTVIALVAYSLLHSTASILANGSIGDASVFASGTGNVYLDGVEGQVQVGLQGIGSVYVNPEGGMSRHAECASCHPHCRVCGGDWHGVWAGQGLPRALGGLHCHGTCGVQPVYSHLMSAPRVLVRRLGSSPRSFPCN